jgi:folate-dependent phosphoribosylglycinamide formyltransferase PurN
LTSDTTANLYLVNRLLRQFDVVGMVVESPPAAATAEEKIARRKRMLERHGRLRTLNKLAYNWFRSRFLSGPDAATVRAALFPAGANIRYERAVDSLTVENINAPACIEFVERLAPDVIAVCGTGVIKPEVFTLAPLGAINIHTGITPDYRSADPIFWAIYCGEPEKVGVTIHHVDAGIDTGKIIRQSAVPIESGDSMASIYARCVARGADLYVETLRDLAQGASQTIDRSSVKGRAFYSIQLGIVQYALFRFRFWGVKRRAAARTGQRDIPLERRS